MLCAKSGTCRRNLLRVEFPALGKEHEFGPVFVYQEIDRRARRGFPRQ